MSRIGWANPRTWRIHHDIGRHGKRSNNSRIRQGNYLKRTSIMKTAFCIDIGLMRFLWGCKTSEKARLSVYANLGPPIVSTLADTKKPGLIVCTGMALILQIHRFFDISKIFDSIVRSVAINVVNFIVRPFSMNVEPRQSVSPVDLPVYGNGNISSIIPCASNLSSLCSSCAINSPAHDASLWIVGKKLVQSRLSDHVAPYQCGKLSKVAAGGDKSLVPRRVSCKTILRQRSP